MLLKFSLPYTAAEGHTSEQPRVARREVGEVGRSGAALVATVGHAIAGGQLNGRVGTRRTGSGALTRMVGCADYITKPFQPEQLLDVVQRHCAARDRTKP